MALQETEYEEGEESTTVEPLKDTKHSRARIKKIMDEHDRIDAARKKLNDEKGELRAELKSRGVSLKAFDAALKLRRLDETLERERWDESFELCRRAAGIPVQEGLFEPKH